MEPVYRCLFIEIVWHVCIGVLGSGNKDRQLTHVSLFGPDLTSRLARPSRRGNVALFADGVQLQCMSWRQDDRVEVRFKDRKGDQDQMGSVRLRTRTEVRGSKSSVRTYGGIVALILELMPCVSSRSRLPLIVSW